MGTATGLRTGGRLTAWAGMIALLGAPSSGAAQVPAGQMLDGSSVQPLSDARVQALRPDGSDVGEPVRTVSDGAFELQLSDTGASYIRVDRLSYGTIVDGEFVFTGADGRMTVDVYLLPTPVELEGVEVTAEMAATRRSLRRQGFYSRTVTGFGDFIGPEEIEEQMATNVTDFMRMIPRLRIDGGILKIQGSGPTGLCEPNVYVDGALVLSDRHAATMPPEARVIDNIVHPEDVSAIEVYRRVSSTPMQWLEPNASCGTVVIWTKAGR